MLDTFFLPFFLIMYRRIRDKCRRLENILNPLTLMSDQDRISPYNINTSDK